MARGRHCDSAGNPGFREFPADSVSCVGFSGQMHGAVLLDANNEVIRPALIWCDQRTEAQSKQLEQLFGLEYADRADLQSPADQFHTDQASLGATERAGELAARSQVHAAQRLRATAAQGRFRDRCCRRLRDAATGCSGRRWSTKVLSKTGIDSRYLPKLFESPGSLRHSQSGGRGGHRLEGGYAGCGRRRRPGRRRCWHRNYRPGLVSATIGTSGVVFAATDRPALDPRGRLHTFCHAVPGRWHVMGVTQAAGLSLRWFRDNFGSG